MRKSEYSAMSDGHFLELGSRRIEQYSHLYPLSQRLSSLQKKSIMVRGNEVISTINCIYIKKNESLRTPSNIEIKSGMFGKHVSTYILHTVCTQTVHAYPRM